MAKCIGWVLAVICAIQLSIIIKILHDVNQLKEKVKTYTQINNLLETKLRYADSTRRDVWKYLPHGAPLKAKSNVNSRFGYRKHPISKRWQYHSGVDLSATMRDTVFSTAAGIVVESHWDGGFGRCVLIDHGNGYQTRYAHMSRLFVKSGDHVDDKQPLGVAGSTGASTGVHLHYEVMLNGSHINPLKLMYYEF